jgi:hypothetical protein
MEIVQVQPVKPQSLTARVAHVQRSGPAMTPGRARQLILEMEMER